MNQCRKKPIEKLSKGVKSNKFKRNNREKLRIDSELKLIPYFGGTHIFPTRLKLQSLKYFSKYLRIYLI